MQEFSMEARLRRFTDTQLRGGKLDCGLQAARGLRRAQVGLRRDRRNPAPGASDTRFGINRLTRMRPDQRQHVG